MQNRFKQTPEEVARELDQRLQSACGDVALEAVEGPNFSQLEIPETGDPVGTLADNLYNDEDWIRGMLGDWIMDSSDVWVFRKEVIRIMKETAHDALANVLRSLEQGWWKEHLEAVA